MSTGSGWSWLFCVGSREISGRKILTVALGADGSRGPGCVVSRDETVRVGAYGSAIVAGMEAASEYPHVRRTVFNGWELLRKYECEDCGVIATCWRSRVRSMASQSSTTHSASIRRRRPGKGRLLMRYASGSPHAGIDFS